MVIKGWKSTNVYPDLSGTIGLNSRTYYWKRFFKRPLLHLGAPRIKELIHQCQNNSIVTLRATLSLRLFHYRADLLCQASLCSTG
jgi:hypothetical protein